MCSTKVVAACIFNKLLAAGLFLALDGTSMCTDPSTSGRKYRKSVYNAIFIPNESLFVVSAVATSVFQLKHSPRLLRSICYQIQTIEYGKILVMLLYWKSYRCVYRIAGYFCGVLIFVIFVTSPRVTKFCIHEVFHLRYKLLVLLLR